VGCPIGCPFCASGKLGLARNLTREEIVEQVLLFARQLKTTEERITNIVFMGIGEPLLNYTNVVDAIRFLNRPDAFDLSIRRFSISTAGLPQGIDKLSKEVNFDVNLAISLHSAIDEKRDRLVPLNKRHPLGDLSKALRAYFEKTKRKIMFEYILIKDVNMSAEDAFALRKYINTVQAAYVVNLVPLNQTTCGYETPSNRDISQFKEHLKEYHINFVERFSYGHDIKAACGQLAGGQELA
jgi:23S rRNA (adenine2503-C2)-methyltransferase